MKKMLIAALCALLASCSLSEDPRDQIPESEAYTTHDALYRNTVATLYNYIGGHEDGQGLAGTGRGIYDLQTFAGDEAIMPIRGGDWYDGGLWEALCKHSWSAGHDFCKNSWLYLYKVIALCNRSLETLERHRDLATGDYTAWTAEVRALRAMYYWYLIDLFGDVPLVLTTDAQMNQVTRSPRADVFDFCVTELQEACPSLAASNSVSHGDYYGRVTRGVAYFVLAKLMLNHEVYTGRHSDDYFKQCVNYCDQIEQLGYQLDGSTFDCFLVNNENSNENIFVIPMDKNLYSNQMHILTRSWHYRHAAAYGFTGENGTCATISTMRVFGYGTAHPDNRMAGTFYYGAVLDLNGDTVPDRTGAPLTYYPMQVMLDLSGSEYVETAGARMRKYEVDKNAPKDGKLQDNDIVLFRLADVLLMRAEARVRLGLSGQQDFDLVRARSGMEPRPCTLANLLDERLLELCWEGWRRQDLIRFGQYKSLNDGPDAIDESDGHTRLFPIPADVIALNNNLTQNPGY